MPHIPRDPLRLPPPRQSTVAPPPQQPTPIAEGQMRSQEVPRTPARSRLGLDRISLHKWAPEQKSIFKALFGEGDIDPETGQTTLPEAEFPPPKPMEGHGGYVPPKG